MWTNTGRGVAAPLIAGLLVVATVPAADAGTFKTITKWKNCDNYTSAVSIRATFPDPARYYGTGKYKANKTITWQYYKGNGKWRTGDHHTVKNQWLTITNPDYDYVTTAADRTNWANLYYSHWRAKVTIKLYKNRKGPVDKMVDKIEIFPGKGSFREIGSNCGYDF